MGRILPILFNTEMVRAILDERKGATRRKIDSDIVNGFDMEPGGKEVIAYIDRLTGDHYKPEKPCKYQPDDILYVRETYCPNYLDFINEYGNKHVYKADYNSAILSGDITEPKWTPSIHMPKEAARIWLRVKSVKPQRINEMTLDDFLKEGVIFRPEAFNDPDNAYLQAQKEFIRIWESTLKGSDKERYSWAENPWTWAIEFERCNKPEQL